MDQRERTLWLAEYEMVLGPLDVFHNHLEALMPFHPNTTSSEKEFLRALIERTGCRIRVDRNHEKTRVRLKHPSCRRHIAFNFYRKNP